MALQAYKSCRKASLLDRLVVRHLLWGAGSLIERRCCRRPHGYELALPAGRGSALVFQMNWVYWGTLARQ